MSMAYYNRVNLLSAAKFSRLADRIALRSAQK